MIVCNLCNIKSTNGLLYYGLDYLRDLGQSVRLVLVRPELADAVRERIPQHRVVPCSAVRLLREAIAVSLRGDLMFVPTSHPLPLLSRQWIVVHDSYPFTVGPLARLKTRLLRISLATSRCQVAYINESEVLPFVLAQGVSPGRTIFAPNKFPAVASLSNRARSSSGEPLRVGLVGTYSAKKRYEELLAAVDALQLSDRLRFVVYGHHTDYFEMLIKRFPSINLELVGSDEHELLDFLSRVDVLASVADQEGFGRPIAAALLGGLPCFLRDRRVFREFFDPGASFHHSDCDLVLALAHHRNMSEQAPLVSYEAPERVVHAYAEALAKLRKS